jgi:hypothetical protein
MAMFVDDWGDPGVLHVSYADNSFGYYQWTWDTNRFDAADSVPRVISIDDAGNVQGTITSYFYTTPPEVETITWGFPDLRPAAPLALRAAVAASDAVPEPCALSLVALCLLLGLSRLSQPERVY